MRYWLTLLFTTLVSFCSAKEDFQFKKYFSEAILQSASPNKYIKDYSLIEQDFYLLCNLVRMYPQEFSVMLTEYVQWSEDYHSSNPYVNSLRNDLREYRPVSSVLIQHSTLDAQAKIHAEYCVRTQHMGHQNVEKRVQVVQQKMKHELYGENCSFNYESGIDLFMSLLIDDGVRGVGHRKNILNADFTNMGISIVKYPSLSGYCAVQIFSAK